MAIYDFDEDELNDIHETYNFNQPPSNQEIAQSKKVKPVISYDLVDTGDSNFSFYQDCFDSEDAIKYFGIMKTLCKSCIEDLRDLEGTELHLYTTKGKNIGNELKRLNNGQPLNQMPEIMHFALYTNDEANRENKIKSPRIHFMVGARGIIYPLFYDPYHEMNPSRH